MDGSNTDPGHSRVGGEPGTAPVRGSLVPVPDPTSLTDTAISRATNQFRRELDALRELLAERIAFESTATERAIQAEVEARDRAVDALARLTETRLDDLDTTLNRAIRNVTDLTEQSRNERHSQIAQARDVIETRLDGMDKATELVAAALDRFPSDTDKAVGALRELLGERIDGMDEATKLLAANVTSVRAEIDRSAHGLKEIIDTRLSAMDEATKLLATNVDKVPYAILQEAGNLKALILSKIEDVSHVSDEKFKAVESTFASNALALTAALAAQEKAVAEQNKSNTLAITKSEVTTKETIAANAAQTQTGLRGLEQTFADLKERVVRIESTGAGATANRIESRELRTEQRLSQGAVLSIVVAAVIAMGVVISLITLLHKLFVHQRIIYV